MKEGVIMSLIKRDGSTADFDSKEDYSCYPESQSVVEPEDRIDQERIEAIAHVESKKYASFSLKIYRIW